MPIPGRRLAGTLAAALVLALAPALAPTAALGADPTTGSVVGTLADGTAPVADAVVDLVLPPYGVSLGQTHSDAAGRFRLDNVRPATYALRFTLPGGLVQFHPGVADLASATQFAVVAGQEVTIDEAVMAHGTLGGRVTTDGGAPAAGARVRLNRTDGPPVFTVLTDANGDYRFAYPPAGRFRLAFAAAERGATDQYAHRQRTPSAADPVVITPGQHTTVDERLLPVGTISGRFTRDGAPVANVVVQGQSQASTAESVSNFTAADGTFRLRPYPGSYKLKFVVPAGTGLDQWAGGAESEAATVPIRVEADGEVVLEERQLPTGRVSGRLTDAAGAPVARAAVVVADPSRGREFVATTDDDGAWFHTVWPGTYTVRYETASQVQWATGAESPQSADPVTVAANGETVVDDALRPPGALTVTAVDARTGARVASFCADVHTRYVFQQGCTEDGAVDIPELGAGSYEVTVTDGVHLPGTRRGVRVVSGRRTAHVARLAPAGTVRVALVDAGTDAAVPFGCVTAVPAGRAAEPDEFVGGCADESGRLSLDLVPPDGYAMFAAAHDGAHGAQWVGPRGGVGAQSAARVLTVAGGATADVTVRFDGVGAVAGTVVARNGGPLDGATVAAGPLAAGGVAAGTDAAGGYALDGLGPYRWTLFTSHPAYAGQWSGGGNDRLAATGVRVTPGGTTRFDVALRPGATLTGVVTGPGVATPDEATVTVVDGRTFDAVATATTDAAGRYAVHVAGPRTVKVAVTARAGVDRTSGWHRDAAGFARARTVSVPSGGTVRLDLRAPDPLG